MRLLDFVAECADAIAESQRMQEARQQALKSQMKQSMFKTNRQRAQASRAMRSFFSGRR